MKHYSLRALAAACAILALVPGCAPDYRSRPPSSVETGEVLFIASTLDNRRLAMHIDAVDRQGQKMPNLETGLPYPSDYTRESPYTHALVYTPGSVVTVRFEAIMAGQPGDELRCQVFDNGVEIPTPQPRARDVVPVGARSAAVTCIYTTR